MKKFIPFFAIFLYLISPFIIQTANAAAINCNDKYDYYNNFWYCNGQGYSDPGGGGGSYATPPPDAPTTTSPLPLSVNAYYLDYRNEYRADYTGYPGHPASYGVHFVTADTGVVYNTSYTTPPTGIMYLTCNGTYTIQMYDAAGRVTYESPPIRTDKITNGTCSSYAGQAGGGYKDFNTTVSGGGLQWDPVPGAVRYDVFKDGQKITTTTGTSLSNVDKGSYSIVAKDANGNIVGQSDANVVYTSTPPTQGCGDVCQNLTQLLQCPAWSDYMGQLGDVIRNNVPPPPDWDKVAGIFVNHFSDYFGDVPRVPGKAEIDQKVRPPMPTVNTTDMPEAQVTPAVPDDFKNGPLPFDIKSGPEIPVVDESKPIDILDPNTYIHADAPGKKVLPGDPSNHSDGIASPKDIPLQDNVPAPTSTMNSAPPVSVPVPSGSAGTVPIPSGNQGTVPIPEQSGGGVPIPKIP